MVAPTNVRLHSSPFHSALSDPKYLFEDDLPDMSETKDIKLRNEKSENVNIVPQEMETHKFVQTETNNKLSHHRTLPSLISVNKIYKKHFDNVLTSYDPFTLLRTVKDEDFSKDPPVKPQSGEIYLLQHPISPDDHHKDWCCDGIS